MSSSSSSAAAAAAAAAAASAGVLLLSPTQLSAPHSMPVSATAATAASSSVLDRSTLSELDLVHQTLAIFRGTQPSDALVSAGAPVLLLPPCESEEAQVSEVTVAMNKNDVPAFAERTVATSSHFLCYSLKNGYMRLAHRETHKSALLKKHSVFVSDMEINGPVMVSGARDGQLIVWSLPTEASAWEGQTLEGWSERFVIASDSHCTAVAVSEYYVAGVFDGRLYVFALAGLEKAAASTSSGAGGTVLLPLSTTPCEFLLQIEDDAIARVSFSSDSSAMAVTTASGRIVVLAISGGSFSLCGYYSLRAPGTEPGTGADKWSAAFFNDERERDRQLVAAVSQADGTCRLFAFAGAHDVRPVLSFKLRDVSRPLTAVGYGASTLVLGDADLGCVNLLMARVLSDSRGELLLGIAHVSRGALGLAVSAREAEADDEPLQAVCMQTGKIQRYVMPARSQLELTVVPVDLVRVDPDLVMLPIDDDGLSAAAAAADEAGSATVRSALADVLGSDGDDDDDDDDDDDLDAGAEDAGADQNGSGVDDNAGAASSDGDEVDIQLPVATPVLGVRGEALVADVAPSSAPKSRARGAAGRASAKAAHATGDDGEWQASMAGKIAQVAATVNSLAKAMEGVKNGVAAIQRIHQASSAQDKSHKQSKQQEKRAEAAAIASAVEAAVGRIVTPLLTQALEKQEAALVGKLAPARAPAAKPGPVQVDAAQLDEAIGRHVDAAIKKHLSEVVRQEIRASFAERVVPAMTAAMANATEQLAAQARAQSEAMNARVETVMSRVLDRVTDASRAMSAAVATVTGKRATAAAAAPAAAAASAAGGAPVPASVPSGAAAAAGSAKAHPAQPVHAAQSASAATTRTVSAAAVTAAAAAAAPNTLPVAPRVVLPNTVVDALSRRKYGEAFSAALAGNNVAVVEELCARVPPKDAQLFDFPQPVILSLIQQLAVSLADRTDLKITYLCEVLPELDAQDPAIARFVGAVLRMLIAKVSEVAPRFAGTAVQPSLNLALKLAQASLELAA